MFAVGPMVEPDPDRREGFRRSVDGDWLVLNQVDATDPVIPCLLLGVERPLRIDIAITVDGKPFRSVREEWIDLAIRSAARNETQVPDPEEPAASVAPQSTGELSSDDPEGTQPSEVDATVPEGEPIESPPARFQSAPPIAWLTRYFRAAGEPFDRVEARWLLAQRAGGPALLELQGSPTLGGFRTPLVNRLDRDHDGEISTDELAGFSDLLAVCDQNEDDLLTLEELQAADPEQSVYASRRLTPSLFVLDDTCDMDRLRDSLARQAGGSEEKSLTESAGLQEWLARRADLVVDIRFNGGSTESAVAGTVSPEGIQLQATEDSLVASFDSTWVEFVAGEVAEQSGGRESQVSLGVTIEGLPLWNLLDANQDASLSRRERDGADAAFRSLDRDRSGTLTAEEIPTSIRVAACWGSEVAQLLEAKRRSPVRRDQRLTETVPAWFASMDANGDGDLSRDEFLGAPDQFARMDTDRDGLISPTEAAPP